MLAFRTQDSRERIVLEEKIGSGSYGEVHVTTIGGKRFALKVLRSGKYGVGSVREIDTLTRFVHPNIMAAAVLPLIAEEVPKESPFIVGMTYTGLQMPLADGDLWGTIRHTFSGKKHKLEQVLTGIAFMHEQGLIHMDIKPENVLVVGGQAIIGDFGSVYRTKTPGPVMKRPATTPRYRSPELWEKEDYSPASDIWAWGIMAMGLLFGKYCIIGKGDVLADIRTLVRNPDKILSRAMKKKGISHQTRASFRSIFARIFVEDPKKRPTAKEILSGPVFFGSMFQGIARSVQSPMGEQNYEAEQHVEALAKEMGVWEECATVGCLLVRRVKRTSYSPKVMGTVCFWIAQKAWGNNPIRARKLSMVSGIDIEELVTAEVHIISACLKGGILP